MSVRNVLTLNGVVALLIALSLILFPSTIAGLLGIEAARATLQLLQFIGASSVGYGIASWQMRSAGPSEARTAFLNGGGIGYIVVGIISSLAVINGLAGAIAWAAVAAIFILGLLFLFAGLRQ